MPFQIQLMLINVILYVWWYITILKKCSNLFRNFICSIGFIFYCFPRIRKDPIRNRPNRGPKIGPYACVFFFFQNLWSWSHLWKVSCFYPKVQWDSYSLSSIRTGWADVLRGQSDNDNVVNFLFQKDPPASDVVWLLCSVVEHCTGSK